MAYDRYGDDRRDDYRQGGQDRDPRGNRDVPSARDYGNQRYGQREQMRGDSHPRAGGDERGRNEYPQGDRGSERPPQGYDHDDRGFVARVGDEVRSWFGDDDAERRRDQDARQDEQRGGSGWGGDRSSYGRHEARDTHHHDHDYHSWRSDQMSALDRDYAEFRRENRAKFESEFSAWRTNRQSQRDLLKQVDEHMEVLGSDGAHVGTVDKIRGDRMVLTRNDPDAGGRHHSVPCSWLQAVEAGRVTLSRSSTEAKAAWRDEEREGDREGGGATGRGDRDGRDPGGARDAKGRVLGRSSGSY